MVIMWVDNGYNSQPYNGDIQITDMVITDIGILIETAMATAIDCENGFSNSMPCNWQVCVRHH